MNLVRTVHAIAAFASGLALAAAALGRFGPAIAFLVGSTLLLIWSAEAIRTAPTRKDRA